MLKFLFLIVIVISSSVFIYAQEKPQAYKIFEYEKISNNLFSKKIKSFCNEVDKTSWVGWILNFGTPKEIAARERQILDTRLCTKEFPSPRIIFVKIDNKNKSQTELWIVPPGEKPPTP